MPTLAAVPTAQAITVLASQIPAFDGSEDKDVESWIHLVDLIANAHGVGDDVTLLAASSKLLKQKIGFIWRKDLQIIHGSLSRKLFKNVSSDVFLSTSLCKRWKRENRSSVKNRSWNTLCIN